MLTPTNVASVWRFIGFMNYLSKFLPWPSDVLEPLCKLTLSDVEWFWTDSTETITLQCDTSDKGAGAVLLFNGQPVTYMSWALTDTETNYVQTEKEVLAVVYSLEKTRVWSVFGRQEFVESNHKPLEVTFKKWLYQAPKRCTPQMYSTSVGYRKRSSMHLADILSWANLPYDGS